MPLYEYCCEKCGNIREVIQKFSDPPLAACEACGGTLERLISPSAIQFKGAGWYVNDYGKKGSSSGKNAGTPSSEAAVSESSSETKSENSSNSASSKDKKSSSTESSTGSKTTSQSD